MNKLTKKFIKRPFKKDFREMRSFMGLAFYTIKLEIYANRLEVENANLKIENSKLKEVGKSGS
jgi:hypothetical protein